MGYSFSHLKTDFDTTSDWGGFVTISNNRGIDIFFGQKHMT
jgi:hypothetical protein